MQTSQRGNPSRVNCYTISSTFINGVLGFCIHVKRSTLQHVQTHVLKNQQKPHCFLLTPYHRTLLLKFHSENPSLNHCCKVLLAVLSMYILTCPPPPSNHIQHNTPTATEKPTPLHNCQYPQTFFSSCKHYTDEVQIECWPVYLHMFSNFEPLYAVEQHSQTAKKLCSYSQATRVFPRSLAST